MTTRSCGILDSMLARWQRFWFDPSSPTNLGLSRLSLFAGVFAIYAREDFSAWADVSPAFWIPTPLFAALHVPLPTHIVVAVMEAAWRVLLVCSAIGFCTRVSMVAAFLLGTYLLGLSHNFGHLFHFDGLLVVVLAILACSRAGDAWSIDAWLRTANHVPKTSDTTRPAERRHGEYTWPIRMVQVMMALAYLAAGLSKLRYSGLAWVTSPNLSIVFNRAVYHFSNADPLSSAGLWIARDGSLSRVLAGFTLAMELGFVTALFSRAARIVFVPAAFVFLIAIRVLLGPTFGAFLIVNVFWVPWDAIAASCLSASRRLTERTSGRVAAPGTPFVATRNTSERFTG